MEEKDQQFSELKELFLQSEQRIRSDLARTEKRLDRKIDTLREEIMDGFAGVAEAIETVYTYVDGQFIPKPRWLRAKI